MVPGAIRFQAKLCHEGHIAEKHSHASMRIPPWTENTYRISSERGESDLIASSPTVRRKHRMAQKLWHQEQLRLCAVKHRHRRSRRPGANSSTGELGLPSSRIIRI